MGVQDVYKFTENGDQRRIVAGTPDSGSINVGEEVVFYPSGKRSRIKSIESFGAVRPMRMEAGFASGFTLEEEIYIRRGELACRTQDPAPLTADCVRATVFWFGREPVRIDNTYHLKTGAAKVLARVEKISRVWDASERHFGEKEQIDRNEIAECVLSLDRRISFDTSGLYPAAGRFVLVDRYDIVGGGILLEMLKRPDRRLSTPNGKVTYLERCRAMGQSGLVLWFTGLSGAGKSTIAIELERELMNRGIFSYRLDGDNIRDGLNSDLHFSLTDRMENIRRISEVARLFLDSGMIALVSFISPLRSMRERAKSIIGENAFVEVYVRAPMETCIARDVKGLYAKALNGSVKNFTGVSSPYEEPDCPDLVLDTERDDLSQCVHNIIDYLEKTHRIPR
jgi:bifunctional enzyme CysN/CysC